jgi:hypothetical protein
VRRSPRSCLCPEPVIADFTDSTASVTVDAALAVVSVAVFMAESTALCSPEGGCGVCEVACSVGSAALSELIAFSTSSCGVGWNWEIGALSSAFLASTSFVAHLRWKALGVDCRGMRSAEGVVVVIDLGLDRTELEGEERSRNAVRRR